MSGTSPTTAWNSGWFTSVENQRFTAEYGLRNSLSSTNLNGYTRAEATTMSARVICSPTRGTSSSLAEKSIQESTWPDSKKVLP
ncbi:uncharacterized protein KRP23_7692 [Phytophthora ramorum]|uniref:uncharacterized protein n=1 Tax=Phytophthora ramorum TaxID=164328 RepID=UPI0030A37063|nr:hypothetical protein KRP23_7692 [Phytophthora ramorum]